MWFKLQNKDPLLETVDYHPPVQVQVNEQNGAPLHSTMPASHTPGMAMYQHFPLVPMYPNVMPSVPIYHPHNQSFPIYPQVYATDP